jgi:hypothetical protein
MKNTKLRFKKLLSTLLAIAMVFSLFSEVIVVEAADPVPSLSTVLYQRITENTPTGPKFTDTLTIRGMNFENPEVYIGQFSDYSIPINTALSTKSQIIIDNQDELKKMAGKSHNIIVYNNGTDQVGDKILFDLTKIPTITNISKSKAYIGDSLDIGGLFADGALDLLTDKLFVAGTEYSFEDIDGEAEAEAEAKIDPDNPNKININKTKAPNTPGIGNVAIERIVGGEGKYKIEAVLKNSITVVDRLTGIEIERVDPNTGPRNRRNIVNIYGKEGMAAFDSSMRVFVNGAEGANKGTIIGVDRKVIGLSVELPTSNTSGAANIIITNSIANSEFEIINGFIYQDIGNGLSIDTGGISPSFKKETENKEVTITGRNIGFFDGTNYDKLTVDAPTVAKPTGYELIKYAPYDILTKDTYKVKYTGKYDGKSVTIIKEISVFVDGEAKIKTDESIPIPTPSFTQSKDTIIVKPANVNLDPNQPKNVDVKIKTTTTVFNDTTKVIYYSRNEEYTVPNGFKYIPDEIAPEITSVTPEYGPSNKEVYMTIMGKDFQVFENGTTPKVIIGDKIIEGKDINNNNLVKVYDNQNNEVDGKIISLGTKIKIKLPAGTTSISGAIDVTVINPSKGQYTKINGFEYRKPVRDADKFPKIISVKEPYADMRGGVVSGEKVLINGENIDVTLDNKIIITIDGEKATIDGKVSADGKTVTIIPPPGTLPGKTKLQLINEDGSMAEIEFEYKRIITEPKITKIVPTKGGKGTKLVIKGEDFMLPDNGIAYPDDPKRKGTVVLLDGKELNAYNYLDSGSVTNNAENSIYYKGSFDPDGTGTMAAYQLDGKMVTVVDSTTIYVDIPDRFYGFNKDAAANLISEKIRLGDLTVQVLNPDGAKSKENVLFTFLEPGTKPTITSINPTNGAIDGGTIVTIKGTNFRQDDLKVYFGAVQATAVEYINTQEIIVKVPIYPYTIPAGKDNVFVPVMVMNYDGAMGVYDKPGFEYRIPGSRPIIESLSPDRGSAAGGEEIIIRGRDFRRKEDGTLAPKVYFNGIEAKVSWVGNGTVNELLIAETPPSKKEGPVDVVIVNYDSGSFTYKSFTYEISKPSITSVTPGVMARQGGTKLQINGTGFKKGDLSKLLEGEKVDRNTSAPKNAWTQIDNVVMFGDASTGDRKIIDTVLGPLSTTINELQFTYTPIPNSDTLANVTISKASGAGTLNRTVEIPIGSAHMFIVNGRQDLGDSTLGDEGVLVEVTPNQVIITRRVATYAKWENDGSQITAVAPAVGSIGKRNMAVKNMDGGTANWDIEVLSPSSQPEITYISPRNKVKQGDKIVDYTIEKPTLDEEYYTYTPLDGGAFITINGEDFRRNVKVYMGNKLLEVVSRSVNDNQLLVKVPKGSADDLDKLYRILVVNEDGATADSSEISKPHYIVYKMPESNPIIEKVTPESTSSKGQNTVRIIGDDFREGVKVLIDGIPSTSVTLITYKELVVKVPLGLTPGKKLIQVMNPDFGFGEKKDAITIISSPEIDTVYDDVKDNELDPVLLSIDGGQRIRLKGSDYLDGAKVILGGTLKPKAELKAGETGIPCFNIHDAEMVIVGGVEATNIKIENSTVLTFTTPKLKVGEVSIIVVNSDGGISNEVNASYQKPYPDAPTGVDVEVVDSDTIKLEWDKVPGTNHYEIYAAYSSSKNYGNEYVYVGSVKAYEVSEGRLRYFVDGLKANSWYSFKLKSVNDYGPSNFSYTTYYIKTNDKKITTFYQVAGDYKGGVAQNDRTDILGSSLTYTAGEKSLGNYGSGLTVNFSQTNYTAYDPKNVDIGIELLRKYPSNPIIVREKDFTLKMQGRSLLVKETVAVSYEKLSDSKMTISIVKNLKAKGDEIRLKVPKGYKAVIAPIAINTTMQVEKAKTSIKALNGNAEISFNVSDPIKRLYPGGIFIAYYNNTTKKLEIISTKILGATAVAQISKPGEYMLLGKLIK